MKHKSIASIGLNIAEKYKYMFFGLLCCIFFFCTTENTFGQFSYSDLIPSADSTKTELISSYANQQDTLTSNPFDVDHVPIEKTAQEEIVEKPFDDKKNLIFITMMISLGLLSLTIGDNKKTFRRMINALNNINYLKLFYRDLKSGYPAILIVLYLFFIINLSLFIFLLSDHFGVDFGINSSTSRLFTIFGTTASLILAKHLLLNYLTYVFNLGNDLKLYSFSMVIVGITSGLALIPLNALIAFSGMENPIYILYLGIILLIIAYLFLCLRGFVMSGRYLVYKTFHFFLYLCIVKLMPIALVIKIISKNWLI